MSVGPHARPGRGDFLEARRRVAERGGVGAEAGVDDLLAQAMVEGRERLRDVAAAVEIESGREREKDRGRARDALALDVELALLRRPGCRPQGRHAFLIKQPDQRMRIRRAGAARQVDLAVGGRGIGGEGSGVARHQLLLLFQAATWLVRKLWVDLYAATAESMPENSWVIRVRIFSAAAAALSWSIAT